MRGMTTQTIESQASRGLKDKGPTPKKFYADLDAEFAFDFDPCPTNPTFDGLAIDWGLRNFCNPPYSQKRRWIEKAMAEKAKGKLTVMLLPVDTSTAWFLDLVLPNAEVRWVRGRLKLDNGKHPAYASMLAIFKPSEPNPPAAAKGEARN